MGELAPWLFHLRGINFTCSTMAGCCFMAVCGYNLQSFYRVFGPILGPSCYDEEFRMRVVLNPALHWDQIHPQLWLQVMTGSRPSIGDRSDSGHLVTRSAAEAGSHSSGRQPEQNRLLCWEFTSLGICNRKPCKFCHECPLCGRLHSFPSCPKPKGKSRARKPGAGGSGQASG